MKSFLALAVLLSTATASSWVFWSCDEFLNFCLEGGTCVSQDNFWVQYSEPNGGGSIEKHAIAFNSEGYTSCPVDGVNQEIAGNGDGQELEVIYKQFDPNADPDAPCPEGQLFEPDGTTLLGTNDGSGTLPANNRGDGFCSSSEASCNCIAYVALNSP